MNSRFKWVARLVFWPLFAWLVFVVAQNPAGFRYRVTDWWRLLGYDAPAEVSVLADQATLTERGRDIFYASRPQLNDKETFNQNCRFQEKTLVLGCFTDDRIYVLDIELAELEAVEPVTAAHEMLHAAWARLSDKEHERLTKLLNNEFTQSQDQHLQGLIQEYRDSGDIDPAVITNELHSILATEVNSLSAELEAYYQQYFTDRAQVVNLYNSYEEIFRSHEQSLQGLKAEIDAIYDNILSLQAVLEQKKAMIDANNARLKQLADEGNATAFNSLLATQRQLISEYNTQVRTYNQLVESYQAKIEQYKAAALSYGDLVQAIDSKSLEPL